MYRGDIEIFEPQKRPVLMDVTLIDPAVQKHSCVGLSTIISSTKANIVAEWIRIKQASVQPEANPCGEICESVTNGPAASTTWSAT